MPTIKAKDGLRPADVAASLDLLSSPCCLIDGAAQISYLNAAWRRIAPLPSNIEYAVAWENLIASHHLENFTQWLDGCLRSKEPEALECELVCGVNESHWFLLTLSPVGAEQGQLWICIATDVGALRSREELLRKQAIIQSAMLDVSVDCIKLIDREGRLIHMNKAGCQALGIPNDSKFGMLWLPLLTMGRDTSGEVALRSALDGSSTRFSGRSQSGEGELFWDNLLSPVLSPSGEIDSVLCVSRDVTSERAVLNALRENEERLAIAARVGGLGVWDYDIREDSLHCDEAWYRIMGQDPSSRVRSISDFRPLIHPDDADRATEVAKTAGDLIASDGDYSIAFRIIRPDGEIRWVKSLAYLQHVDGLPVRAVGFITDITDAWRGELALREAKRDLEDENASLTKLVIEDSLTGIANRRHLDNELAKTLVRARTSGTPFCMGLIDIDRFKQFNDRYGHVEGDFALKKVAQALQSVVRQSDLIARYGGEEFAFILPGTTEPEPMIERLLAAVYDLNIPHVDSPSGRLSISCGAICARHATSRPIQLIRASDEALYEAKLKGRNGFVVRTLLH